MILPLLPDRCTCLFSSFISESYIELPARACCLGTAGKKLAKLEASAAGFGNWSSKSNILFSLALRRLLPKKQFCTCQLSRCACHASRGCCSSHVDGGHISAAAKPKNKSQKNKKEQHTELLQRGARRKGQTKWIKMVHFQCWIIWIRMATTTGGSQQKAPLQAEYGRASRAPAQTGEVRLAIAVHFVRAILALRNGKD